jgi:hypothetical protein
MAEPDRPRSPFAGMADLSASTPVRVLSPHEIERVLADHSLYQETEYHQGHRANFSSTDLTGRDFRALISAWSSWTGPCHLILTGAAVEVNPSG